MIVEACLAAVTAITCASLWFADRERRCQSAEERADPERRARSFAERRRVLERDRSEWFKSLEPGVPEARQVMATAQLAAIDAKLLKLAEEEGRDA